MVFLCYCWYLNSSSACADADLDPHCSLSITHLRSPSHRTAAENLHGHTPRRKSNWQARKTTKEQILEGRQTAESTQGTAALLTDPPRVWHGDAYLQSQHWEGEAGKQQKHFPEARDYITMYCKIKKKKITLCLSLPVWHAQKKLFMWVSWENLKHSLRLKTWFSGHERLVLSRVLGFHSQHLHGGLQLSLTLEF